MKNKNRICYLCGNAYRYCPSCGADKYKPSWYSMFCGEICKDMDKVLAQHTAGKITSEEAYKQLKKIKVFDIEINDEDNLRHLDEILAENA